MSRIMARIGWINPSPRYPANVQRDKLKAWGATKIYQRGEDTDDVYAVIKSLRSGDTFGVYGLHQLAPNMRQLTEVMRAVAKRDRPLCDLELDLELPPKHASVVAAYANAKRVYDAKVRGTPAEYAERGRKGGKAAAEEKRIEFTKADRRDWMAAGTNIEAAQRVSERHGRSIHWRTLFREYGPSGRGPGRAGKAK